MKRTIFNLLFFITFIDAFGTAQIPDILIYRGDTISLFDCPLDYFPNKELLNPKSLFGSSGCFYTACWRNYVATWIIENEKLYLVKIRNACYPTDMKYVEASYQDGAVTPGREYADLKSLFPDRYKDGKVFADWVTVNMFSPKGKMLFYIHDGFESIFEKELEFIVEKGVLKSITELDNSKTRISKYNDDPGLLMKFVNSHINYSNVPEPAKEIKVILVKGLNAESKVDTIRILRGSGELYNQEAIRVINSIPDWDILYRHGKKFSVPWMIPVTFQPKKNRDTPR
jgi:hypothetical protein